ncbi:MAG: HAMP domain-containing histidine kinase [Lachnospiraceae bacterium]|nr:HAMP domain-containing histidine kinase [Lachnospiraceae bacterium]
MNKLMHNLTLKTFLLLLLLSLTILLSAYGCIWLFLPYASQTLSPHRLERQTQQFVSSLWAAHKSDSEPLFVNFIRQTGADISLLDQSGEAVSPFTLEKTTAEPVRGNRYPFRFADSDEEYVLVTRYNPLRSDEIADAVRKSIPFIALLVILLSSVSAFAFSRYTTKPIIRISRIADRIANLDFSWYCPDLRDDEIGVLSQSINELSDKLHAALDEIRRRNDFLEDAILMEKERERRRMLFFSGVSHELKTPIAVVIGQLEGMQAQIGVYRDREKYLARSAEILQSLNDFIREVLLVSHMDMKTEPETATVNLSEMLESLIAGYIDYAEPLSIAFSKEIEPAIFTCGDEMLLKKALGNVVGNAVAHSPEHSRVLIRLSRADNKVKLTIVNTNAHIDEKDLPHLFEAFYRADKSARYGSGLGLYITRMILESYQVSHSIENTEDGVAFTAVFAYISQHTT